MGKDGTGKGRGLGGVVGDGDIGGVDGALVGVARVAVDEEEARPLPTQPVAVVSVTERAMPDEAVSDEIRTTPEEPTAEQSSNSELAMVMEEERPWMSAEINGEVLPAVTWPSFM